MDRYDLIVIGAGPAGEKGAAQAAYFGKRVALVEGAPHVGGAGVNTGTIPSKTLRETARYFAGLAQRGLYGLAVGQPPSLNVRDFMFREHEVVRSLRDVVHENIARHQIELIHGRAAFVDPHTISVALPHGRASHTLQADVFMIATGSVPNRGRDLPLDDRRVYDSDTILEMRELPASMAIVGAGVIGCEYASIFATIGMRVTVVDGRDRLLPFLDAEIADGLRRQLEQLGVGLHLGDAVTRFAPEPAGIEVAFRGGGGIVAETLLMAAGRLGNTAGLGLDALGIPVGDRGHIGVNEHYQTSVPHVYAVGDVIGFPGLAATSMEQARVAMCHAFDLKYKSRVAPVFPLAIYTVPEVAMVGETEESCRDKGIDHCVGRAHYRQNARGQIIGDLSGMLKLVFRASDRVLLGVHVIGEDAAELVHVGMMVMQMGGGIDAFIDAVFNYPTLGDAYKYAAYDGLAALQRRAAAPAAPPQPA
jgi:NAD(P) transhydrogenase